MRHNSSPAVHPRAGQRISDGLHVSEVTTQRPVPRRGVELSRDSKVLVMLQLEPGVLHSSDSFFAAEHLCDAVALFDVETDAAVLDVVVVIGVGHQPLVDTKGTTRLEDTEDLAVNALEGGSVAGGLDGIDGVEGVVGERDVLLLELNVSASAFPS